MADWKTPDNCKYTDKDEWIMVDGDKAKIGLTDYAQDQLSDIVYVDLGQVAVGKTIHKGDVIAAVESVKAASDVYAPAGGTVTAINGALENTPELVNQDAFGAGWLIEITPSNPAELDSLMDAAAYTAHCQARG